MAKKIFTDESLATFVDEVKLYTNDAISTKANLNHTHDIATTSVAGLMSASDKIKLDGIESIPDTDIVALFA